MPDDLGVVPLAAPPALGRRSRYQRGRLRAPRRSAPARGVRRLSRTSHLRGDSVRLLRPARLRTGRRLHDDRAQASSRPYVVPPSRRAREPRSCAHLMHEVFADWRKTLAQTSSARLPLGPIPERGEGSPVRDRAFELIESYPIRSYDAAHAGTAVLIDAPLVCRDVGFAALPAGVLSLITDSTRTSACRRVRA